MDGATGIDGDRRGSTVRKQALVTGGTGGLGRALSIALSADYDVIATGASRDEIDDLRASPEASGVETEVLDVTDAGAVGDVVARLETSGRNQTFGACGTQSRSSSGTARVTRSGTALGAWRDA